MFLFAVSTRCFESERTICVRSTVGQCETSVQCHEWVSLEDAVSKCSSGTTIMFCEGLTELKARNTLVMNNKTNIRLYGTSYEFSELWCYQPFAGFGFVSVTNLQIFNISFVGCSAVFSSTTLADQLFHLTAGLYIINSTNVSIRHVTVKKSIGTGIVFIQTYGYVEILNSTFKQNKVTTNHLAIGGGLYIELGNSPSPIDNRTKYNITRCRFQNNNCTSPLFSEKASDWRDNHKFVRGGGINLSFQEGAYNNTVVIENCEISENTAVFGGGLLVHFVNSTYNNHLVVRNSTFFDNVCKHHSGGIGVHIKNSNLQRRMVLFQECTIVHNVAQMYGGGVRIHITTSHQQASKVEPIIFSNCSLKQNVAHYGSAVDIFHSKFTRRISIQFRNCHFLSNMITNRLTSSNSTQSYQRYESGKGAISCTKFVLQFNGRIVLDSNNGSALHLSSCYLLTFNNSHVDFTNNKGFDGGAIVMFGTSMLRVGDSSMLLFANNTAVWRGGAIMHFSTSEQDFTSSDWCFVQPTHNGQSPSEFSFYDNRAVYGQAVFASTLQQCQRQCLNKNNISNLSCIGDFYFEDYKTTSISTSGNRTNCSHKNCRNKHYSTFPGGEIVLNFEYLDEYSKPSYDILHASVLKSSYSTVKIDPSYTYISGRKVLKLYGKPGDKAEISLTNTDFRPITVTIVLTVELNQCPPGFVIKSVPFKTNLEENLGVRSRTMTLKCVCSAIERHHSYYTGIHRCDSENNHAYILHGYWIGYYNEESEDQLVTGPCPRGFCNYNSNLRDNNLINEYHLPGSASKSALDKFVCTSSRTGKLCGSCRPNYSVFFHGNFYHCKLNSHNCRLGPLLYMLSELLPVTVLFVVVLFCDIKFTSGAIYTFIFFAQFMDTMHIDANGLIKIHPIIEAFKRGYQLFYRMFNLDFFSLDSLSFCLMKTATTLDILAFKYFTIAYSLLLVLTTIIVMKLCNPCSFKNYLSFSSSMLSVKKSVIHGLIAILVMCYSQCTAVSLSILTPGHIYWKGPIDKHNVTAVVYLSGNLPFFGKKHLKYAFPAMIFTVLFIIIPPVLLIVYPLCYKVFAVCHIEESWMTRILCKAMPLEKIKPFFDSVQGCFKDEYRFFGGLYFLYRLVSFTSFTASKWPTDFYTILEIQLILMVVLHSAIQPYRQRWHNVVDISLLTLLALINALTMYNYHTLVSSEGQRTAHKVNAVSSIQMILAYIPIVYIVIYISTKVVGIIKRKCLESTVYRQNQDELEDTLNFVDGRCHNLEYKRAS